MNLDCLTFDLNEPGLCLTFDPDEPGLCLTFDLDECESCYLVSERLFVPFISDRVVVVSLVKFVSNY